MVRIEDHEVEGRLEVDERHLHPGGYVHGGVWVAFADTVAAWGTFRHVTASAYDAIDRFRPLLENHPRGADVRILEPGEAQEFAALASTTRS